MEHKLQEDNNRPSYFGNVKNRLGSKFPAGVSHLPEVPMAAKQPTDCSGHRRHPATGRPLDHVPHIRNPKLRQYYLQGDSLEVNITTEEELKSGQPVDRGSSEGVPEDTVFSITSRVHVNSAVSAGKTKEACAPKGRKTEASSLSELNLDSDPKLWLSPESENAQTSVTTRSASPYSISPEAEYDKLLDVETVPLPDGQLCLLTLPPECSRGEGAEPLPYLKLLCRYITDCKGVVSGILLVTSNKIFFDPCKTHPLVMEHGWEEYLLSCSVDCVASVSFFSDISHVYIDSAQHRWKGKKSIQKSKRVHKGEPLSQPPPLESVTTSEAGSGLALSRSGGAGQAEGRLAGSPLEELQGQSAGALPASVLSSAATLCGAGQGAGTRGQAEPLHSEETGIDLSVKSQAAACRLSSGSPGGLMFVRMRVQQSAGKKKGLGGLMLGTAKAMTRREVWLALSQESSDELYAYLSQWRPDLCILEGEGEGDGDEGDFVLIDDSKEEVEDDIGQRCRRPGEDWELVSMEDSVDKQSVVLDRDPEYLTDVVKESCILEASHVIELYAELPPRTIGHTWQLSYSTSRHGSSLKSLYRKLSNTDSPTLIVIKDALDQMFGSFLSHPLRPSETFYGTGETFLFMLHPRFKCFRWTGENTFFIKGDLDSFAIGGGSGHFGLWLDETLCLGRSSPCYTFNNCCLSETDDFRIMELEVWTFT